MLLLKLAFLNIGRNPRRSWITVGAVAVGLSALIFLWGFSDGTTEQQRENVVKLFTGHVQLHGAGFYGTLAPEKIIPERAKVLEKLKALPQVVSLSERVKCEGLIGTSENSRGILLIGLDPEAEPAVTQLDRHIRSGSFFLPGPKKQILIGDRLAKKLEVETGDKVVVLTHALDGTMSGYSYAIQGIFHTGSEQVDELTAYLPLESARELLGMEGESHEIAIRLSGRKKIPSFLAAAKSTFPAADYEFQTWDEIVPEVEQWVIWSEAIIRTILVTVMIVVGVGIMNTVLMSIYERTRELGVMLAIGTSPSQIMQLVLLETLILEIFGILLGLVGGYAAVAYFGRAGVSFHGVEEAFASSFMSTTVYTQVEGRHVAQSVVTLLGLTSFIGLYPAWKASRMEPVKAIYHTY